jgi:mono/diheme cytochrome c family protein
MNRVQIEITLGILLIMVTSVVILMYGLGEEQRMQRFAMAQEAHAIEVGAELFELQCSRCHGINGTGIPGLCPPLNDRHFFDDRLREVGWSGTLEDYIVATASSGRLTSTRPEHYPGTGVPAMPAFSDQFGGPLREDQVRSIATFIMNWSSTAELVEAPGTPIDPEAAVGTNINRELPEGSAEAGEALAATPSLACVACHITAPTGPPWEGTAEQPGIGARAETRFRQPDYTGNADTPEKYLFESIVLPNVHLVEGYAGVMPNNYGDTLTPQETADLIAYLLTFR